MSILLGMLIGASIIYGVGKLAEDRDTYIVDKLYIDKWLKKYYGIDIKDISCSVCKEKITKENIERVFTKDSEIYIVCKKRECHLKSNMEVINIG